MPDCRWEFGTDDPKTGIDTVSAPVPGAGRGTLFIGPDNSKLSMEAGAHARGGRASCWVEGWFVLGGWFADVNYGPATAQLDVDFICDHKDGGACTISKLTQKFSGNPAAGVQVGISAEAVIYGDLYVVAFTVVAGLQVSISTSVSVGVTGQKELGGPVGGNSLVSGSFQIGTTTTIGTGALTRTYTVRNRCGADVEYGGFPGNKFPENYLTPPLSDGQKGG